MKKVFSAGGVVYKREGKDLKILLISIKQGKVWALPKGLVEKNETPQQAALREIREETGIDGKIIDELGEVSYWFYLEGEKYFKTIKYYLVEYINGQITPQWEIDNAEWFKADEALNKLTYESDKKILEKAFRKIYG